MEELIKLLCANWERDILGPLFAFLLALPFILYLRFGEFWTSPSDEDLLAQKRRTNPKA